MSALGSDQRCSRASFSATEGSVHAGPGATFYEGKFVPSPVAPPHKRSSSAPLVEDRFQTCFLDEAMVWRAVYVLERPRHRRLVAAIRKVRAQVPGYLAGDVIGLADGAAILDASIDCFVRAGSAPKEGLSVCAGSLLNVSLVSQPTCRCKVWSVPSIVRRAKLMMISALDKEQHLLDARFVCRSFCCVYSQRTSRKVSLSLDK